MDPLVDEDDECWSWWTAPCDRGRPPWLLRVVEWWFRILGRTLGLLP